MNSAPLLFLGIFASLATSFWALVIMPQLKMGRQEFRTLDTGEIYPQARSGIARSGAEIYRANGCVECHTQQVRANGPDKLRGWGARITVNQDYLLDMPVMLGSQRIGPDLTNIGARQPDATWHLQHLYNPKVKEPRSLMPRYPYLFERRKLSDGRKPSANALPSETEAGYEIVPKPEAEELVVYLQSLQSQSSLFEAPLPPSPKTNSPSPPPAPVPVTPPAVAP